MKLEELKNKINEMYEKYGDVPVIFDFKTTGDEIYTYLKHDEIQHYSGDDIKPEMLFDQLLIEEIVDVRVGYGNDEMTEIDGILLSNYKVGE